MKHQCAVVGTLVALFVLLGTMAFFSKSDPAIMDQVPDISSRSGLPASSLIGSAG